MASFSRIAALAALAAALALAATPSDAGMVNMNIYDVSEGSKVLSGNAQADLAMLGRRAVLEAQGYTEDEIQKELKILEQKVRFPRARAPVPGTTAGNPKRRPPLTRIAPFPPQVSGWRNKVHTLPPDLAAVMTAEEREEAGPVGDMTYGELEALVTKLTERMHANEQAFVADHEAAAANGTVVEGVDEDSWKIDEREMARRHGAAESEIPEKSLHDLEVESELSGESVNAMGGRKSYTKLKTKLSDADGAKGSPGPEEREQAGFGRFNSLRDHPLHPQTPEEAKTRGSALNVPGGCAAAAGGESTCEASLADDIEAAKAHGVEINYAQFTEADIRQQELELLNHVQEFANQGKKKANPTHVEL